MRTFGQLRPSLSASRNSWASGGILVTILHGRWSLFDCTHIIETYALRPTSKMTTHVRPRKPNFVSILCTHVLRPLRCGFSDPDTCVNECHVAVEVSVLLQTLVVDLQSPATLSIVVIHVLRVLHLRTQHFIDTIHCSKLKLSIYIRTCQYYISIDIIHKHSFRLVNSLFRATAVYYGKFSSRGDSCELL